MDSQEEVSIWDYDSAFKWVSAIKSPPALLLGNGFSIAYNYSAFSYSALRQRALDEGLIGRIGQAVFDGLMTQDFELVIKTLSDAVVALEILDASKYEDEIVELQQEVSSLKEALARVLAGLHPERPAEIPPEAFVRVRTFLAGFGRIYTANYDLLLYWALMQGSEIGGPQPKAVDDGFRNADIEADHVVWDYLTPHSQTVHYLHGALHLYRSPDEASLKKLTWIRTGEALIDQIRRELAGDSFPLYVAEGSSAEKLARIQTSDYLAKGLRSIVSIGGGMVCFGLSFSENDEHIVRAIDRGKVKRLAVSLYGDPDSASNRAIIKSVQGIVARRAGRGGGSSLEAVFFDSESVALW